MPGITNVTNTELKLSSSSSSILSLVSSPALATRLCLSTGLFWSSTALRVSQAVWYTLAEAITCTQHIAMGCCLAVSDDRGVFLRTGHLPPEVKAPGRPGQPPLLRVQTLQSCSPSPGQGSGSLSCVVDWAHHTFALSPFYCYSKSSVFTADNDLVPHLELEMGVVPGTPEVLFYLSMDPKYV